MKDFEISIIKTLRELSTPFIDGLLQAITFLGEQYVLIAVLAVVYFIFDKRSGQRIAYAIFTSISFNGAIKGVVKYERPFVYDTSYEPVRVETATGYSFPSGHTQNASVTYTSLALQFKKKWLFWIVGIIIFLIGISRVGLGVHYPKDVLFGWIFGIGCAFLGNYLHHKFEHDFKKLALLYVITFAIFLPFVFIFWRKDFSDIKIYRDFYTGYAMFAGFIAGSLWERKVLDFDCQAPLGKKLIRLLGAIICVMLTQFGLDMLFPEGFILLDMLRYFLVSFVTLGLYPILFKNSLFKK
ncbi:MAG: phosphatase PAP2 family protein [Bacilli bacterium]|nr:phosphatase PAP2 family protein [Bacilli bacterium]MDY0208672.1 phosphatase PAP2 family protein [Bacilli bacterium]